MPRKEFCPAEEKILSSACIVSYLGTQFYTLCLSIQISKAKYHYIFYLFLILSYFFFFHSIPLYIKINSQKTTYLCNLFLISDV